MAVNISPEGYNLSRDIVPTTQSISEYIYRLRFEYSQLDMRDRLRYSIFNGDNDIPHPSHIDFQEVHNMIVNNAVQNIIGLLSNRPTTNINENSLNTLKLTRATSVQNCMNALFPALEDDINEPTWLKILFDQILYGRAYDILEYFPTRWANQPRLSKFKNPDGSYRLDDFDSARKKAALTSRLPFIWRHLPARGCFVTKDDFGIQQFLSIEERSAIDIAHSYNMPHLLEDLYDEAKTPSMHVIFCRYWNRSYYAYWVSKGYSSQTWEQRAQAGLSLLTLADTMSGEIAETGPNIYGVIPVVETQGMASTDQNPARKYLSVVDPMIPLAVYLDQLVSQKGSAIRVYCWPTPYIKNVQKELGSALQTAPIGPEGRPDPLNVVPGQIMYLPGTQDIGWLVVPEQGPDIDKQIAWVQQEADKLVIPSSLFDGSSQQNGYLFNSMMSAATSRLGPMIANTKRAHKQRIQQAFRCIEIHDDSLYLYDEGSDASDPGNWTSVTPKDVQDWKARYVIKIDYEDEHPYDMAADISAAVQLTTPAAEGQEPLVSKRYARTNYLHIDDPDKEAEQIRIESTENSPLVSEFLSAQASMDAGISLDKIQNDLGRLSPEQLKLMPPSLMNAARAMGQPLGGPPQPGQMPQPPGSGGTAPVPNVGTGNGALAAPGNAGGMPNGQQVASPTGPVTTSQSMPGGLPQGSPPGRKL